jgi:ferritin-like metal-binding protein YciE
MASLTTLHDLFVHELKDLYSAEKQLLKALPKMAKAANSENLRAGFEEHLAQTEEQVARLEKIFDAHEVSVARVPKCVAMEGLIKEGSKIMEEDAEPAVMDAALIAAAQKVEHYEIAGYGTVLAYARMLDQGEAAKLLETTLNEEKETDERLTELAESEINVEAQA